MAYGKQQIAFCHAPLAIRCQRSSVSGWLRGSHTISITAPMSAIAAPK
jgi:hypothetical protein